MTLSIRQLMIHSTELPACVRLAIKMASEAPVLHRAHAMESSASLLSIVAGLDIEDARELLDLSPSSAFEGVSATPAARLRTPEITVFPEAARSHDFA